MKQIIILLLLSATVKAQTIPPSVTTINVTGDITYVPNSATEGTISAPKIKTIEGTILQVLSTQNSQSVVIGQHETAIKTLQSGSSGGSNPIIPARIVTGSSYKLTLADHNSTIVCTSTCTITAGGLPNGFRCYVIRKGSGEVSFSGSYLSTNSYKRILRSGTACIFYDGVIYSLSGNLKQ